MRIPFDSICLAAVVCESQWLVGGRVDRIDQWDETTIGLCVFLDREEWLLVSADAQYARAHLMSRRRPGVKTPPPFGAALRKHLMGSTVTFVRQRGLDRILEIGFDAGHTLIAELMGKHSNLILCDGGGMVVACAKAVGLGKSKRPILPGRPYSPPPFEARASILTLRETGALSERAGHARDSTPLPPSSVSRSQNRGGGLSEYEGASPFLVRLIEGGVSLTYVKKAIVECRWSPVYVHGAGAYPLPLDAVGVTGTPRGSFCLAAEQHFESLVVSDRLHAEKQGLASQLARVYEARRRALVEIEGALDAAARARQTQERAELILAYQATIPDGARSFEAIRYDGTTTTISLNPELSPIENANALFEKARRAKQNAASAGQRKTILVQDYQALTLAMEALASAESLEAVGDIRAQSENRRWLHYHAAPKAKEERPYAGHSIKEALSPNGWTVLYGENATSNDYLTTKVARPNDFWFHVRGVTSAHVILQTQNRPGSVQPEDLKFAARIAADKSASKHAHYVTVDYVLKKYVRKPRKSAPGAVTYSMEKTIHIER